MIACTGVTRTSTHIQTKAFLLTLKALCADKPLSRGGFLRIKLVARLRVGVTTVCWRLLCLTSKEAIVVVLSANVVAREVVEEIAAVVGEMPKLVLFLIDLLIDCLFYCLSGFEMVDGGEVGLMLIC